MLYLGLVFLINTTDFAKYIAEALNTAFHSRVFFSFYFLTDILGMFTVTLIHK